MSFNMLLNNLQGQNRKSSSTRSIALQQHDTSCSVQNVISAQAQGCLSAKRNQCSGKRRKIQALGKAGPNPGLTLSRLPCRQNGCRFTGAPDTRNENEQAHQRSLTLRICMSASTNSIPALTYAAHLCYAPASAPEWGGWRCSPPRGGQVFDTLAATRAVVAIVGIKVSRYKLPCTLAPDPVHGGALARSGIQTWTYPLRWCDWDAAMQVRHLGLSMRHPHGRCDLVMPDQAGALAIGSRIYLSCMVSDHLLLHPVLAECRTPCKRTGKLGCPELISDIYLTGMQSLVQAHRKAGLPRIDMSYLAYIN
eukprot:1138415-Pelagomonas_calceolata.AAC.5